MGPFRPARRGGRRSLRRWRPRRTAAGSARGRLGADTGAAAGSDSHVRPLRGLPRLGPVGGAHTAMKGPETRVARVCDALNRHRAKYGFFGATALQLWGSARATRDIDILIEPTVENARCVLAALTELGFGLAKEWLADELVQKPVTVLDDSPRVDILTVAWAVHYGEASADATSFEVEGCGDTNRIDRPSDHQAPSTVVPLLGNRHQNGRRLAPSPAIQGAELGNAAGPFAAGVNRLEGQSRHDRDRCGIARVVAETRLGR